MKSILVALAITLTVGIGPTLAQTDTKREKKTDTKMQTGTKAKPSDAAKAAISKSCTDQANAKGLHGVARKKFRSKCKKAGGKPS